MSCVCASWRAAQRQVVAMYRHLGSSDAAMDLWVAWVAIPYGCGFPAHVTLGGMGPRAAARLPWLTEPRARSRPSRRICARTIPKGAAGRMMCTVAL